MTRLLPILLLAVQFLLSTSTKAQHKKFFAGKEPAWITVNALDYNNSKLDGEAEDGYLDLAYEKQVSLAQEARFYKKAIKILSESGVENSSEVAVVFDPSYEQLTFHTIRIVRSGRSINKLNLANFKTIQQEKDLSRHLYDGSLTALLLLDDVRKGDVIEYSYTLKGFNPIFNGKYTDMYDCRFSVPVANLYYKLIVPAGRNINIKNSQTPISPVINKQQDATVYEWKVSDITALHLENKTPGWYDPYAMVMVSEYNSWHEVSAWATALFPRSQKLSPGLQKKIDNIRTKYATNEERIMAALHLVQDDVRYMGIEMGEGSHKPSHPDKIFAQRFGDCKDKSYLLSTMLNAMGIEASPVLINTVQKKSINNWLPSSSVFDHVTVQVKTNGKVYYFDPTISLQRGSIDNISYPDYQAGLVVNEATTALTGIPFHEPGLVDIKEVFTMPDMSGTARFKVITTNTGSFADNTRNDFSSNSLYEMKHKYKDFYAAYFKKITVDSLTASDNETTGAFTTTEYYTIDDIWKNDDGTQKSAFSSFVINSIMTKPADQNRTMPFYLIYPAHYKEQIEINLPEPWSVKPFDENITCSGFALHAKGWSLDNKVVLDYEYENLKDHIMPNEAANFFANYDQANEATGYSLSYKSNEAARMYNTSVSGSSLGTFTKLYIALGVCVVMTFLIRRKRQQEY